MCGEWGVGWGGGGGVGGGVVVGGRWGGWYFRHLTHTKTISYSEVLLWILDDIHLIRKILTCDQVYRCWRLVIPTHHSFHKVLLDGRSLDCRNSLKGDFKTFS